MNYLPFVLLAYLLNSIAVTIDKILLSNQIRNPLLYIFYISLFSLLALLAIPFTYTPSLTVFLLSSASTLFWTFGAYLLFKALKIGQVSRVIPIIGTLTPLTLTFAAAFSNNIAINEIWAAFLLIFGLVLITITDWKGRIKFEEILCEIGAALLFAISYLFLKEAYLQQDFLTVLVWSRMILLPLGAIFIFIPSLRRIVVTNAPRLKSISSGGLIFILGQIFGGASNLLLTFSISLANPALVNSLQGVQYVFLLIFSVTFYKSFPLAFKKPSMLSLLPKTLGILFIALGLYILTFSTQDGSRYIDQSPRLGVTYSPRYAEYLGLEPKSTFRNMLDDLSLKRVRLPVYWDDVEIAPGEFNFSNLQYYLDEAFKKNVEVILVLGQKQPRWPECSQPPWVKNLSFAEKKTAVLKLLESEVNYFKNFPHITVWQVENEPLFEYGICDPQFLSTEFLKMEIDLVRKLDSRPILITDSGELFFGIDSIKDSDLFGLSLYRMVWTPYLGVQSYPLPPIYYSIKERIARAISKNTEKMTIISELQAEPWLGEGMDITEETDQQVKLFPPQKLKDNFEFAKQTNFAQIYFWGVEWWYFMDQKGYHEYLDYAKSIFNL